MFNGRGAILEGQGIIPPPLFPGELSCPLTHLLFVFSFTRKPLSEKTTVKTYEGRRDRKRTITGPTDNGQDRGKDQ